MCIFPAAKNVYWGQQGKPEEGEEKGKAGLNQSSFTANSCNGRVKGRKKGGSEGGHVD